MVSLLLTKWYRLTQHISSQNITLYFFLFDAHSAQTGSGKTAGFLFPIIITMIRNGGTPNKGDSRRRVYPEALVLAPTREVGTIFI